MNYNELIVDLQKIPLDREDIAENLDRLIRHAAYLEKRTDIVEPLPRGILDTAPSFMRKQLERLRTHLDDEVDIIAWLSRSLMELRFMLRCMYRGKEQYDELIKEQLKDLKDIEKIIFHEELPVADTSEDLKAFHADMNKLWEALQKYGIERGELKSPSPASYFAKGADLLHEYQIGWKIHSKYVHPTSYLLFGRREFVYGDWAKKCFWAFAQYYAARNLRDLHKMIEAIP
jgi:hypothetical protein